MEYVDPDIEKLLAEADPDEPDFWELTPELARAKCDTMIDDMLPPVHVRQVRDLLIPLDGGESLAARAYLPSDGGPLLVFFHGGGWEVGTIELCDRPLRRLANDSGFSIISVEYRLAPENPFPAGLLDCYAATQWAYEHQTDLGGDGSVFAVAGDSAGGNLAAAVAQLARDEGGPTIDHQLLIYPVVTPDFSTDSYQHFGDGYFLTTRTMQSFWNLYVGDAPAPKYADLLATDTLAGLPPATVFTCGLDPLRDEGDGYARALSSAGVPVTSTRVNGLIHGVWYMDARGPRAYQFGLDIAGALRRVAAISAP